MSSTMLTKITFLLISLGLGLLVGTSSIAVVDEAEKLLDEYQSTIDLVLASAQENLDLIQSKIGDIGTAVINASVIDLDEVRAVALQRVVDLEASNRERGIDVTSCTDFTLVRINTLSDALVNMMIQCIQYRVEENDLLVRQIFSNIQNNIVPVAAYRTELEQCKLSDRVEECVIRLMVTISATINFLPETVQEDVRQADSLLDNLTPAFHECYDAQAQEIAFHGEVMYNETAYCVQDIYWSLSTENNLLHLT